MKELLNNDSLLAITERLLGKKIGKDNIYKIQQAGTKYVGHVYFDVADDFLYECIVQTTGTTNTTANFKKTGVRENEDKLQNLIKIKNEIKTSVSFRSSVIVYSSATLREFKDSDMIYLICDTNNAGEGYAYIAPVSLFRNGPSGTRVTLEMLDTSISNVKLSLGVETSTGNLTLACSVSGEMYLRYACVISSII